MQRTYVRLTVTVFLVLAFSTAVFAGGQFWNFLGYTHVDGAHDHSLIQISRHDLSYRILQLRVSGESIFFDRLTVHFADGTSQELVVSARISPGGRNYVIDLFRERVLESVELWYYKEPWDHNPTVSAYGVRLPDPDTETMAREN